MCDKTSIKVYHILKDNGFDILYDDRIESAGGKFSSMDLIGIPIQIIIGPRGLSEGILEIKFRKDGFRKKIPFSESLVELINEMKE